MADRGRAVPGPDHADRGQLPGGAGPDDRAGRVGGPARPDPARDRLCSPWCVPCAARDDDDEAESALRAVGLLGVAGITIANGGDNIAIYTPVFRTISTTDALVTIAVFLVLLALWCLFARAIGTNEKVTEGLEKVEHWLVPVVFIGLGVFILIESGTLAHIASLL